MQMSFAHFEEVFAVGSDIPAALSRNEGTKFVNEKVDHEPHVEGQKTRPLLDFEAAKEACGHEISFLVSDNWLSMIFFMESQN